MPCLLHWLYWLTKGLKMKRLKMTLKVLVLTVAVTGLGYAVTRLHYRLPPITLGGFVPHLVKQHSVKTNAQGQVLETEDWNTYVGADGAIRRVQERHSLLTGRSDVMEFIIRPSMGTFFIMHAGKEIQKMREAGLPVQHLTPAHYTSLASYIGTREIAGVTVYGRRLDNGGESWQSPDYGIVEFYHKETGAEGKITIEITTESVSPCDESAVYQWPIGYQMVDNLVR